MAIGGESSINGCHLIKRSICGKKNTSNNNQSMCRSDCHDSNKNITTYPEEEGEGQVQQIGHGKVDEGAVVGVIGGIHLFDDLCMYVKGVSQSVSVGKRAKHSFPFFRQHSKAKRTTSMAASTAAFCARRNHQKRQWLRSPMQVCVMFSCGEAMKHDGLISNSVSVSVVLELTPMHWQWWSNRLTQRPQTRQ
jgi:hypothetical protein